MEVQLRPKLRRSRPGDVIMLVPLNQHTPITYQPPVQTQSPKFYHSRRHRHQDSLVSPPQVDDDATILTGSPTPAPTIHVSASSSSSSSGGSSGSSSGSAASSSSSSSSSTESSSAPLRGDDPSSSSTTSFLEWASAALLWRNEKGLYQYAGLLMLCLGLWLVHLILPRGFRKAYCRSGRRRYTRRYTKPRPNHNRRYTQSPLYEAPSAYAKNRPVHNQPSAFGFDEEEEEDENNNNNNNNYRRDDDILQALQQQPDFQNGGNDDEASIQDSVLRATEQQRRKRSDDTNAAKTSWSDGERKISGSIASRLDLEEDDNEWEDGRLLEDGRNGGVTTFHMPGAPQEDSLGLQRRQLPKSFDHEDDYDDDSDDDGILNNDDEEDFDAWEETAILRPLSMSNKDTSMLGSVTNSPPRNVPPPLSRFEARSGASSSSSTQSKPSPEHPQIRQVPEERIWRESLRRLEHRGVRLTAHGVQCEPKRIWLKYDDADQCLTWQTEFPRQVQNQSGTVSIVLMRGALHRIPLANVVYLDVGKKTSALQKTTAIVPPSACFSLLTQQGSLDLQTNSKLERDAIVSALCYLMDIVHPTTEWRKLYLDPSASGAPSEVLAGSATFSNISTDLFVNNNPQNHDV